MLGRLLGSALALAGFIAVAAGIVEARTADAAAATAMSVLQLEQPSIPHLQRVAVTSAGELTSSACKSRLRSADALIRLNIFERERLNEATAIDSAVERLRAVLQRAAACEPTNAMMWLGLAWLEGPSTRDSSRRHDYWRLAFATAPREAWVAMRRLQAIAPELEIVPAELKDKALADFRMIVASGFMEDGYTILVDKGWASRDLLLDALANVDSSRRDPFAAMVTRRTALRIEWPGEPAKEARPWR